MEKLQLNKVYTGTVEGYSSEGLGIVRLDGAVVFVPRAVRGEIIDLRITKVMKTAAAGEIVKIKKSSPERTKPECPYFGVCGGCDFQHLSYAEELWAKRQRVQDALTRLGGTDLQVEEILGAKNPLHYRNKSQYPVGADGSIGFYKGRTHAVVAVDRCMIQTEQSDATARAVGEWMRRYKVPAYDERTGKGLIRHVYVRTNRKGETLCCVLANGKQLPREPELAAYVRAAAPKTVGVVLGTNTRPGNVILGEKYRTLWGESCLMDTLCGLTFKLSVPSFYQVNRDQAEVLYGKALEFAGLTGAETVLDLYCGTGTITLCMAGKAKKVIGAEIVPAAIRDAEENAVRNHIGNAEFFCGDAADIAAKLEKDGLRPDVITVDPPRKGLAPEVIASVAAMGPSRVVYVSCDPATLGRDVKIFAGLGYQAVRAAAVDMFPGTKHVETVVLLSKLNAKQHIEVELNLDELDLTAAESKATYDEIKAYVLEKHGLKVSSLYISQVKRKCGLDVGQNYNLSKKEDAKVPQCPPEKEAAIMDALKHFQMI
ncbi:23S rRNA (uracil(1939)-C(5))-methyltransferase RlmD [Dysosmobacter sp. HCP28S3_G4]|uniref:23S rRNA (uracil(1939)-C(5))-methyltransferase RlmD n=1 Tax=Dysosmobacter sp. HCP28S3_G4 TaxID=3438938 RepID=UPI003F8C2713